MNAILNGFGRVLHIAAMFALATFTASARADVFQWEYINPADPSQGKRQSTTLAPGGAGVDAVPGANLRWQNLTMAYLIGADLTFADGESANLTNADLSQANLTNARLDYATLTSAEFTGAEVRGASFAAGRTGLTTAQLYSTASYQDRDLTGIRFRGDLSGWNFTSQNLANAEFDPANVTGTDFTGATVRGANLYYTIGFTLAQLYSTASYEAHDLTWIQLPGTNLSSGNFAGQNLTNARLEGGLLTGASFRQANLTNASFISAKLTGADFTGARVRGARFSAGGTGLTMPQLYSTASYQAHDLTGIHFGNDLSGWNFAGQNLTNASFWEVTLSGANFREANLANSNFFRATLTGADFTGADVRGASFDIDTSNQRGSGITLPQLYSTASYQDRDLSGIGLAYNDLAGANFAGQNLTNANFYSATLTGTIFREANLANSNFDAARLTVANFTDAQIRGASFDSGYGGPVITLAQLYSTASYQAHDLTGVSFGSGNLSGWNFAGQNLTNSRFGTISFGPWTYANLTGADFTSADTRGTFLVDLSGAITTNLIWPDGHIDGLNLAAGEKLVAYTGVPIPVKITGEFSIATGATFDITDNAAIVDYSGTSPVATVRDKVLSGRGGSGLGKGWNGMGITSSAAATTNTTEPESRSVGYAENSTMPLGPFATFRGQPVDGTSILIAYTRTGDANLDGVVNDDDVTIVSATYAPGVPQASWALGDFDYNGFVDDDDVTLLGAFYDPAAQALTLPSPDLPAAGARRGITAAAVPEPGTVALLVIGLIAVLLRHVARRKVAVGEVCEGDAAWLNG
jgi:uncharacterized protein YjbI with pentapeptide repeats